MTEEKMNKEELIAQYRASESRIIIEDCVTDVMKARTIHTHLGNCSLEGAKAKLDELFLIAAKKLNVPIDKVIMNNTTSGGYFTCFISERPENTLEFNLRISQKVNKELMQRRIIEQSLLMQKTRAAQRILELEEEKKQLKKFIND